MGSESVSVLSLFRSHPRRTVVLVVGPLLLASAQTVNVLVHGLPSPLVLAFVAGLIAFALAVVRQTLASAHTALLERTLFED